MIYLDNAATTFPKPDSVILSVSEFMKNYGGNPGRGGHYFSRKSAEIIYECRENLAKLINAPSPERIVFTKNATEAINLAIKGVTKSGDEIILSSMEHNSVLRSAIDCEKNGVTVKIAQSDPHGYVTAESFAPLITDATRLICIIHSSNVVGTVNPIEEIAALARKKGILTLVDAAQSGGILPIDSSKFDMIAFAGHKGLYGPFGTGALYIREGLLPDTLIEGGTGSMSESALMPEILPDRYEAGTLNACGIAGLNEGIKFVMKEGVGEKEAQLGAFLHEELQNIRGIRVLGKGHSPVAGILLLHHDCVDISARLDSEFSIASRAGLHCAPMAHRSLGTVTKGLLRLSVGFFNTKEEISSSVGALSELIK
jgi:cysteine desulfurase family protein